MKMSELQRNDDLANIEGNVPVNGAVSLPSTAEYKKTIAYGNHERIKPTTIFFKLNKNFF